MTQSISILTFGQTHKSLGLGLHTLEIAEAVHIVDNWCLGCLEKRGIRRRKSVDTFN